MKRANFGVLAALASAGIGLASASPALASAPPTVRTEQAKPSRDARRRQRERAKGNSIFANVSRRHPDAWVSPKQHAANKPKRAAGQLPWKDMRKP